MKPVISVIIPVYNAGQHVHAAISSILNQTFSDIECIVVDDCSSDNSCEVVRDICDSRLLLIEKMENEGYPCAMNKGLDVAQGNFIARMDADDISINDRLEKQLKFLVNHPEMAFVGTWRYWIGKGKNIYPEKKVPDSYIQENWISVMEGIRRFADSSVMVRHEYVREVGGYRTYQRSGQDVDLWLRILENHDNAATLPDYLYGRRLLTSAITFSENTHLINRVPRILAQERKNKGSDCLMRGEPLRYEFTSNEIRDAKNWRITMLINTARTFYKIKDYSSANSFTKAALLAGGWNPHFYKLWAKCILGLLGR